MPTLMTVVVGLAAPGQAVPEAPSGYGWMLLRGLLALAAVCALAYVVLKLLSRRLHGAGGGAGLMRVVARLPLEPRRSLHLVEVAGRYLLVGTGESGAPATLAELDAAEVEARAARAPTATFAEVLRARLREVRGGAGAGAGASDAAPAQGAEGAGGADAAPAGPAAGDPAPTTRAARVAEPGGPR